MAYSPLGFGTLTGKYDATGIDPGASPEVGRLSRFASMRQQRWSRPEALAAAREYNALAREHGLTPTQMALAFCYRSWRVASTIIGVTSVQQVDEAVAAWGTTAVAGIAGPIDAHARTLARPGPVSGRGRCGRRAATITLQPRTSDPSSPWPISSCTAAPR
jgi:aryl-alcohol dehydrogenase-like predicted oxidoreductase